MGEIWHVEFSSKTEAGDIGKEMREAGKKLRDAGLELAMSLELFAVAWKWAMKKGGIKPF